MSQAERNFPHSPRQADDSLRLASRQSPPPPRELDHFLQTISETLLYHLWYFWAAYAARLVFTIYAAGSPSIFRLLPTSLTGVLFAGLAQNLWTSQLTNGSPKDLETAIASYLRSQQSLKRTFVQAAGILVALFIFGLTWRILIHILPFRVIRYYLTFPALPLLRRTDSGVPIDFASDPYHVVSASLVTEFFLSEMHWWGIGLVAVNKSRVRGLNIFRSLTTPLVIAFGRTLPTGRPSVNSSVALISGFRSYQSFLGASLMAVTDIVAGMSTILVPRCARLLSAEARQHELLSLSSQKGDAVVSGRKGASKSDASQKSSGLKRRSVYKSHDTVLVRPATSH